MARHLFICAQNDEHKACYEVPLGGRMDVDSDCLWRVRRLFERQYNRHTISAELQSVKGQYARFLISYIGQPVDVKGYEHISDGPSAA